MVERLHRRLLDVIKDEFDRRGRSRRQFGSGAAALQHRRQGADRRGIAHPGYYLGSNVSYNVKKLVEMGYPSPRPFAHRPSVGSDQPDRKGQGSSRIVAGVYDKHARTVEQIGGIAGDELARVNVSLQRLERYWTDQIKYRL